MTATPTKETRGFETEVKALLNLVIHSLYSNKEIFLRELISNASDALDKLRFSAIKDNALYENDSELSIKIDIDEANQCLKIVDNGIGMSRAEVEKNLGTIAHSGTRAFLKNLSETESKDSHLIGQFGVGFYSGFIVAKQVVVKTRSAQSEHNQGVQWSSDGEGEYVIEAIDKKNRGTEIILYLKDDAKEFLDQWRIRQIITQYSDHINWPIHMDLPKMDTGNDSEKKEPEMEDTVINRATALWTLPKSEIKDEQYHELYKHLSHDMQEPLTWSHNRIEGKQQYISLLYIPKQAPFDLSNRETKHGLKLFVQRVFITDKASHFLPTYLRFVRGIIDSSDLPLNISREILQENPLVEQIRQATTKRVLSMLNKLSKDQETYQIFWQQFGAVLKEGPIEDFQNKESIAELFRLTSTHENSETQNVSLDDYLQRMDANQENIYYITASSYNAAKNSPHLEHFRAQNIEVLLLHERIDEWWVNHLGEYKGKKLQSVTKGDLNNDNTNIETADNERLTPLLEKMKNTLSQQVKLVRLSHRLTESPACLVADDNDMSQEMQRILQSAGQNIPKALPILEINAKHIIIKKLETETNEQKFNDLSLLLFEQAILAEGGQLDDPGAFVKRLNDMLFTSSIIITQ